MSTGMAIFVSITAIIAAGDGTSPSMVLSARLRRRLMVWSTCYLEMAARKRTCTAHVNSKESVRKSTRVLCAWDFGSVTAPEKEVVTPTLVGNQCPGSTWKKYHPRRLKNTDIKARL